MKKKIYLQKVLVILLAVMLAVAAVQSEARVYAKEQEIASGDGWKLGDGGTLTIETNAGMEAWAKSDGVRRTYGEQVTGAEIKDGVTYIPDGLFQTCEYMTWVTIPGSVKSIGNSAFYGLERLTDVRMEYGLETISTGAFDSCRALETITIPDSVTDIGSFEYCDSLAEIKLPEGLKEIPDYAFRGCALESIRFPQNLEKIGRCAFDFCESLKEVTIPGSVRTIGGSAFRDCLALETVRMLGDTPPEISSGVFGSPAISDMPDMGMEDSYCKFVKDDAAGIHVPAKSGDAYKSAWTEWADYIVEDPGVVAPPVITEQPQDITVDEGGSYRIFLEASGDDLSYQWWQKNASQDNWSMINGENRSSHEGMNASSSASGMKFRCVVSNDAGTVTSEEATLTVRPSSVPEPGGSEHPGGGEPDAGDISKDVERGKNAPVTSISTPTEILADMIALTDMEKAQIAGGTNIRIVLDVKDMQHKITPSDKGAVEAALNGFAAGQYLDISLYKLIGENRTDITETSGKLTITIDVPDSLKNRNGKVARSFAVVRVHDGQAEMLHDLDDSTDTITIETDRFSTYAIVYKDTATDEGDESGSSNGASQPNTLQPAGVKSESAKDNEPKTGDDVSVELYATLAMVAGFTYLLVYFAEHRRGMTEETKKELISRLVRWAKRGSGVRRMLALAAIFVLLLYYHSVGKKTALEWKAVYGK